MSTFTSTAVSRSWSFPLAFNQGPYTAATPSANPSRSHGVVRSSSSFHNALQVHVSPQSFMDDLPAFPFLQTHCPYRNATCHHGHLYHRTHLMTVEGGDPTMIVKIHWCLCCERPCMCRKVPGDVFQFVHSSNSPNVLPETENLVESPDEFEPLEVIPLGRSRRARSLVPRKVRGGRLGPHPSI